MRSFLLSVTCLFLWMLPGVAAAQTIHNVPPGGAAVVGPFGPKGQPVAIESVGEAEVGDVFLSDGRTTMIYRAPAMLDAARDVTIAFTLSGEAAPRTAVVRIDPQFSAMTDSAMATALEWLFVLVIIALFIEAAVLVLVSVVRALIRLFQRDPPPPAKSFKPSVYKPVYALVLSALAVFAFGIDPLSDIMEAFGNQPAHDVGDSYRPYTDGVITALLLAGGAESIRRIAISLQSSWNLPDAAAMDRAAERADLGQQQE